MLRLRQGEAVELRWSSDRSMALHLHGYDLETEPRPVAIASCYSPRALRGAFPSRRMMRRGGTERSCMSRFIPVNRRPFLAGAVIILTPSDARRPRLRPALRPAAAAVALPRRRGRGGRALLSRLRHLPARRRTPHPDAALGTAESATTLVSASCAFSPSPPSFCCLQLAFSASRAIGTATFCRSPSGSSGGSALHSSARCSATFGPLSIPGAPSEG